MEKRQIKQKQTDRTVQTQGEQHQEEDQGPNGGPRHSGQCLRIHHEHESIIEGGSVGPSHSFRSNDHSPRPFLGNFMNGLSTLARHVPEHGEDHKPGQEAVRGGGS